MNNSKRIHEVFKLRPKSITSVKGLKGDFVILGFNDLLTEDCLFTKMEDYPGPQDTEAYTKSVMNNANRLIKEQASWIRTTNTGQMVSKLPMHIYIKPFGRKQK